MEKVFVVIDTMPNGFPGYDVAGVFRTYEDAQAYARSTGIDQCLVKLTDLHEHQTASK